MSWDVIVVGARCAGSPTAMQFARKGNKVLLLERSKFPRDILSSHYIHQPGVACLASWGLLDRVMSSGCAQPIHDVSMTLEQEDVRISAGFLPVDGQSVTIAPRRYILDQLLADAAIEAGVEMLERTLVTGLLRDDMGRVVGVKWRSRSGVETSAKSSLVVGADGMRSTVAKHAGSQLVREYDPVTCTYYSYWNNLPSGFELYAREGAWVGVIPTNYRRTLVMSYFPQEEFEQVRHSVHESFNRVVASTSPSLARRLKAAQQDEIFYGTGRQLNFFRTPSGPGWVLVGDAVHHKDSIRARGISDAFLQAEYLVNESSLVLRDPRGLDSALQRYSKYIFEEFTESFRSTLNVAAMRVPPSQVAMFRAIQGRPDIIAKYFGTLSGACSLDDFYDEELLDLVATNG